MCEARGPLLSFAPIHRVADTETNTMEETHLQAGELQLIAVPRDVREGLKLCSSL